MSPTPIVVIGRSPKIASAVRKGLHPEYDVIHIILSVEQGVSNLPLLLSNPPRAPKDSTENLGSQKYESRPKAVAVGGGFNDALFREMKDACKDVEEGIVWIRTDTTKSADMPSMDDPDAFGAALARRIKTKLDALQGRWEENEGVSLF